MHALRPYQADTVSAIVETDQHALAVLATGAGKTAVFASTLDRLLGAGDSALVLAHREELISQAAEQIRRWAPDLTVEVEQASAHASRHGSPAMRRVVVASVATLRGKRLAEWPTDAFLVIVTDEAHHSTAATYRAIYDHFSGARRIGVTATPHRTDGTALGTIYETVVARLDSRALCQLGYLVPPRVLRVTTTTDLSGVSQRAGDFAAGELAAAVDTDARTALIVAAMQEHAADRQSVVFAASVDHAAHLATALSAAGIPAEAIFGAMPREERAATIARFRAGDLRALTNFGVLTEGFDAPETSCIVLARPTTSHLVITQMVGRGLRLAPEKSDCVVLDIADTVGRIAPVGAASALAGIPPQFAASGEDVFALASRLEALDPRLAARARDIAHLAEMEAAAARGLSVEQIDLEAATAIDPTIAGLSRYTWSGWNDHYALRSGRQEYRIDATTLGAWTFRGREFAALGDAVHEADRCAGVEHPDAMVLVDRAAKWRSDQPSDKQVEWLLRKRLVADEAAARRMTKGQASALLDTVFRR